LVARQVFGLLGPNGSGKTTTIRMALGIYARDAGEVETLGNTDPLEVRDRLGYLPEDRGLYKELPVLRTLVYFGVLRGMARRDALRAAEEWLERLDLTDRAKEKLDALSKGNQQKVQFIASILHTPSFAILDEPFSGLDPVNLEVLRGAILELVADGATVIFSTHDMTVAEQLCDNVIMIFKGDKVLDGTMEQVYAQYGQDTIRVRTDGGVQALQGLPGVEQVLDLGRYQELRVRDDSQDLLRALMERTRVRQYEETRPTLHDIFIRIAGPEAAEATENIGKEVAV